LEDFFEFVGHALIKLSGKGGATKEAKLGLSKSDCLICPNCSLQGG
jgi:hypothetical protein